MKKKKSSETKIDSMRLFCSLARKLEDSGTAMFNYLNHEDFDEPKFCNEDCESDNNKLSCRYSGTIPLKRSELPQLHQKLKLLSGILNLDEIETLLLVACLTKEMEIKSGWNETDILGFFSFRYTDYMVLTPVFARMVKSGVFVSDPSNEFRENVYVVSRIFKDLILSDLMI